MAQYIEGNDRNQSMLLPAAIDGTFIKAVNSTTRSFTKTTIGDKVQAAVDAKHHLIATVEVTQDGNDQHSLDPVAQQAKQDLELAADPLLTVLVR